MRKTVLTTILVLILLSSLAFAEEREITTPQPNANQGMPAGQYHGEEFNLTTNFIINSVRIDSALDDTTEACIFNSTGGGSYPKLFCTTTKNGGDTFEFNSSSPELSSGSDYEYAIGFLTPGGNMRSINPYAGHPVSVDNFTFTGSVFDLTGTPASNTIWLHIEAINVSLPETPSSSLVVGDVLPNNGSQYSSLPINFNVSYNSSADGNVTLYINDTIVYTTTFSAGNNSFHNYSSTNLTEGQSNWY